MEITAVDRICDEWADTWSSLDIEKVLPLYTDDCLYEDVTLGVVNRGIEELRTFGQLIYSAFPDFKIDLASRFVAGSQAAMEWTMSGTHQGDIPGMPATGRHFSLRGSTILGLQDGKINRCSDYWDMATFLKQIGLMPAPEQAGA